jgi:hypothetical protein
LKISQKSENHRIAYIQYGQIANEIRVELALEPSMRKASGGLIDLIRIKMKNLLEVSEIVDSSIIHEYLSKTGDAKRSDIMHWFTRERNADAIENKDDALGRPHVLKLANRVESYVDIENKVMRLPHAGRSSGMSSSRAAAHMTTCGVSDAGSSASANASNTSDHSNDDTVSGIMV